jgi:quercetin dioxygenase-like cupin family protein
VSDNRKGNGKDAQLARQQLRQQLSQLPPRKRMEAHLVTLTERTEVFPLFQHPGTELVFMLEGEMVYGHGEATYTLGPGDALQLDGEGVHGPQELLALPIRFLSVVAYGDDSRA